MSSPPYFAEPKVPPELNIPRSNCTVTVYCIDSTARATLPTDVALQPTIAGRIEFTCPAWSFLIENDTTGKKVLFDLGVPKDWEQTLAPATAERIQSRGWSCTVDKNVATTLEDSGWDSSDINAIIWSHQHWDHTGDPSTFPRSTDLVVGPGFKAQYLPGFPEKPDATLRSSWWEGRNFIEHDIASEGKGLKIGRFEALDYFGDGSFYLLHTPGHTVGHLCGLARTTADTSSGDTFVLMGGDACHHGGEFRPTEYLPFPTTLQSHQLKHRTLPCPCPGETFMQLHPTKNPTEPFYKPSDGINIDKELGIWTAKGIEEFDAHENVLVAIAHDSTFLGHVDLFPKTMNQWKTRQEKENVRWRFLEDFV